MAPGEPASGLGKAGVLGAACALNSTRGTPRALDPRARRVFTCDPAGCSGSIRTGRALPDCGGGWSAQEPGGRGPPDEEHPMAIRVKARGGETTEQMMRRFKKLCEKEGLNKDVKRKEYYEKPSERRRRDVRKSIARRARELGIGPVKNPRASRG